MKPIGVGDEAPEVTGVSQTGEPVSLSQFRGRQAVVLYFYPKAGSPVCTQQACAFRDAYEEFVDAGAAVIGVSAGSPDEHREFADSRRLPFILISDTGGALRRAYGVPNTLGLLPGRVTYVIDKHGIVRLVFRSQLNAAKHIAEALRVVRELAREP